MYTPKHFAETRVAVLHDLMRAHPLAALVTQTAGGLVCDHVPLLIRPGASGAGTLIGHVARANPVWRDFDPGRDVLAIFQGPAAYIPPAWYPTKAETGRVVPTWNYAVVHARGRMRAIEDRAWLRAQVDALTTHMESPRKQPWGVGDAPADYIETLLGAIVGVEIEITDVQGKWKLNQNKSAADRAGMIEGLAAEGHAAMAELTRERSGGKD